MMQTVEAEIDIAGNIRLLEPVKLTKTSRAIVTILDEKVEVEETRKGDGHKLLELLKSPEFADRKSYSAEEIDAQIDEIRNSWE